jgi:hypothetical protein
MFETSAVCVVRREMAREIRFPYMAKKWILALVNFP